MSYFTNATISCFIIICLHSPRVIGKVSQQNRPKGKRKRTGALDAGIDLPYHRSWHQFSSFTILRFALTKLSLTRYLSSKFLGRIPAVPGRELSPLSVTLSARVRFKRRIAASLAWMVSCTRVVRVPVSG